MTLNNNIIDPLLAASACAAKKVIINSLITAEDMMGHKGHLVKALPHDRLIEIIREHKRIQ